MEQSQVELVGRKLLEDRGTYFRGTARIRFENLQFGELCPRELNQKFTDSLKSKFITEGCLRLDAQNRIPAVISQQMLSQAIDDSPGVTVDLLLENSKDQPPELLIPSNVAIECLQGLHRVAAAKEILPCEDWWWTIDLYLEDISAALRLALSEEYSNSANFSDGEIYLKLRQYHYEATKHIGAVFAEKRMLGRLSQGKRKILRRILKNILLTAALDALRVFTGLWTGFRFDNKLLLDLKCDREIQHYLEYILHEWTKIFRGIENLTHSADNKTVKLVELRAPGFSPEDRSILKKYFRDSDIFSAIRDRTSRQILWENLKKAKNPIPSLYSLFEDLKYLKAPAKIMRQLFPKSRHSTYEAMNRIFKSRNLESNTYFIQHSEGTSDEFFWKYHGTRLDQFEFGYRTVWLHAWRHWTEHVPECPRKEDDEDTPLPQEPNPRKWYEIGVLARRSGFESDEIQRLVSLNPDREVARKHLERACDLSESNTSEIESYITQICSIYEEIRARPSVLTEPHCSVTECGEALERRCGRVFSKAYKDDRKHLFLGNLYNPDESTGVSSFFIRASVFYAFFGSYIGSNQKDTSPPQAAPSVPQRLLEPTQALEAEILDDPGLASNPPEAGQSQPNNVCTDLITATSHGTEVVALAANEPLSEASNTLMVEISDTGAESTSDIEMGENRAVDRRKISLRIWEKGRLTTFKRPIPLSISMVERAVRDAERAGYTVYSINGGALTAKTCFDDLVRNRAQAIFLSKEKHFSRQMLAAMTRTSNRNDETDTQAKKRRWGLVANE